MFLLFSPDHFLMLMASWPNNPTIYDAISSLSNKNIQLPVFFPLACSNSPVHLLLTHRDAPTDMAWITFVADSDTESDLIISIGKGFFSRSVCAAAFSSDDLYLAAIGCDDHHSMGIW